MSRRLAGWWRLWIALSVTWMIALVALLFVAAPWPSVATVELTDKMKDAFRAAHFDTMVAWVQLDPVDGVYRATRILDPFDGAYGVHDAYRLQIDSLRVVAETATASADLFVLALLEKRNAERQQIGFALLRAWAVPSLLILLGGLGVAWVRRGFQQPKNA